MGKYIRKDGTVLLKIISPGQGTSAYYEEQQLMRDAPMFKGAHVFWDHPGKREESDRPERSLRNLAGIVVGETVYDKAGSAGPGVYGSVKPFKPYRELVEEMAPYIGASVRAFGKKVSKVIDGTKRLVAEGFNKILSVDFVTKAGRGGQAVPIMESAFTEADRFVEAFRKDPACPRLDIYSQDVVASKFVEWALEESNYTEEENMVDEAKFKEATDKNTTLLEENAKLKTAIALRDARDETFKLFEAYTQKQKVARKPDLPDMVKARLIESLVLSAPVKEGVLDKDAFTKTVETAITDAEKEVNEITTKKPGIAGMGAIVPDSGRKHLEEVLTEMHKGFGKTDDEAKALAEAAARGR